MHYRSLSLYLAVLVLGPIVPGAATAADYVGTKACADCHQEQYDQFQAHSKKADSWKSVTIMASDLKPAELEGCYECHTTGHGKGGFVSLETTPHLADVGCETCHGAGSTHAETGDPADITRQPTIEDCESCHNSDRIRAFNYKPLIRSGAH